MQKKWINYPELIKKMNLTPDEATALYNALVTPKEDNPKFLTVRIGGVQSFAHCLREYAEGSTTNIVNNVKPAEKVVEKPVAVVVEQKVEMTKQFVTELPAKRESNGKIDITAYIEEEDNGKPKRKAAAKKTSKKAGVTSK